MNKNDEIQVIRWHDAVRRRPAMYIGDTGRLGLRFLARELFECPQSPRRLNVIVEGSKLELSATSVPVFVEPRQEGRPIYLVEIASGIQVPIDHPPSIAMPEIIDIQAKPVTFTRVPVAPPTIAIANALSSEMQLVSRGAGVATEARFRRGVLVSPPTKAATTLADGLAIVLTLDPEIFSDASFVFEDLAEELRDFALRRRVDVELRDLRRDLLFAMSGTPANARVG